jgi:hypothetical protein
LLVLHLFLSSPLFLVVVPPREFLRVYLKAERAFLLPPALAVRLDIALPRKEELEKTDPPVLAG